MNTTLTRTFEYLRTERLILRKPQRGDVPAIFAIHGDPKTNRYNPHGPMQSSDEAVDRLDGWLRDWAGNGLGYWSVLDARSHEIMGFGGVRRMQWAGRDVLNLYYRFSTKSWGQGYATEVARTAVQLAQEYLPELPVIARISPVNLPSIKVAERLGLVINPDIETSEFVIFTLSREVGACD